MKFGVAYYPNLYDKPQIERDAADMRDLGITLIRTGDLTWYDMEPEDGAIDLSLYEYTVEVMAEYGIQTMLATPTAAVPKWLADKHPQIMMQLPGGDRKRFGKRRHACINNEAYRQYVSRITRHMAERFAQNPNVVSFQIDNELMAEEPYCYCETCRKKFQKYLKHRYQSVDALNACWGNGFWSLKYNDFEKIELPVAGDHPEALNEYYGFCSDCATEFFCLQADIIKTVNPGQRVSTNICSSGFLYRWDLFKLAKKEDFASIDNYPYSWTLEEEYGSYGERKDFLYNPHMAGFALSQTRGLLSKPFWVAEAQVGRTAGKQCKLVEPGRVRSWTVQEWMHGAESVIYFAYRRFRNAQEHTMSCIMDYDETRSPRWYEIRDTIRDINDLSSRLPYWRVDAKAAVVRDFEQDFVFEDKRLSADFRYMRHVQQWYDALLREGLTTDIISLNGDFTKYRLVAVPSCAKLSDAQIQKLESYAYNGGTLMITAMTGIRDQHMNARDSFMAKPLEQMAGIKIIDSYALMGEKQIGAKAGGEELSCRYWFDWIKVTKADVMGGYTDSHLSGSPCITRNKYGQGNVYYLASVFDVDSLQSIVNKIRGLEEEGKYTYQSPLLEVMEGTSGGSRYIFALNHDYNHDAAIFLRAEGKDAITNEKVMGEVIVPKMNYRVFQIFS